MQPQAGECAMPPGLLTVSLARAAPGDCELRLQLRKMRIRTPRCNTTARRSGNESFLQEVGLVDVTDLENGRSVTVRINDRGPYVRGRSLEGRWHSHPQCRQ